MNEHPHIQFETDAEGKEVPGIIKGVDRNGRAFEIRDFEHIANSAHEMGCVASMVAGGYHLEFTPTQVIALGFFLLKCGGAADGWPSPEDIQTLLQREYPTLPLGHSQFMADKMTIVANAQLGQKLVKTSLERDQLKRNADDLYAKWVRMVTKALEQLHPKTIVFGDEGALSCDAATMLSAIREGSDEGLAFIQQIYVLAMHDMERKLTRNPLLLQTSKDPRIVWKPHGTGHYMHIGPVHLQTYRQGRWIAAATHQHRSGANAMLYADDLEDEATAAKAALRMAREFLEQDAAATAEAIDNLCLVESG
ncbi:hypothetical protein EKK58_05205 [Candidatus Dependentiae bacterium]|nr:MAG: hypothetical protein EKK58_05205 [Candidatus Dependentiae bacterium]